MKRQTTTTTTTTTISSPTTRRQQRKRGINREEDVTLDDLIRDKAIRPGDMLCFELAHTKNNGEQVLFKETGHVTADGWVNDEYNDSYPALEQWAYAMVERSKKLTPGQCGRLINTCDLWKHIKLCNSSTCGGRDTLDNIRKYYVEWVLSNKKTCKKTLEDKVKTKEKNEEDDDDEDDGLESYDDTMNDSNYVYTESTADSTICSERNSAVCDNSSSSIALSSKSSSTLRGSSLAQEKKEEEEKKNVECESTVSMVPSSLLALAPSSLDSVMKTEEEEEEETEDNDEKNRKSNAMFKIKDSESTAASTATSSFFRADSNADTLPVLRTPPGTPQKKQPQHQHQQQAKKDVKVEAKPNLLTPEKRPCMRSPCLDTTKKRPRLQLLKDYEDTETDVTTANLDQFNDQLDHYSRMLDAINARESASAPDLESATQLSAGEAVEAAVAAATTTVEPSPQHTATTTNNSINNKNKLPINRNNSSNSIDTEVVILPTGLRPELNSYLSATAEKLGGTIVAAFSEAVTHVVTETDEDKRVLQRTLKYAQAVIAGKPVVTFSWVLESSRRGTWAPEEPFEVIGDCCCSSSTSSSSSSGASGGGSKQSKGCRNLFKGKEIYVTDAIAPAMARELEAVVAFGGGRVLGALPAAPRTTEEVLRPGIVVVAPSTLDSGRAKEMYLRSGQHPVSYKWIMDSVSSRALADTKNYEISVDINDGTSATDVEPSLVY